MIHFEFTVTYDETCAYGQPLAEDSSFLQWSLYTKLYFQMFNSVLFIPFVFTKNVSK